MLIHAVVLPAIGWLICVPTFIVAVGSQLNIGESATSSVASSAFHLSLAPVGALLAVAGDVLDAHSGLLRLDLL